MFRLIDESRFTPEEIHEIRRREDMIEWERRLIEIISGGEGLSVMLNELALGVEAIIPEALGSLMLLGADGGRLHFGSAPNLPSEFIQAVTGSEIGANSGSCGTAAYLKEAVLVSDINEDPRWSSMRHLASPYGLRACWSVPIFSRRRGVLGTLAVYFQGPRVATPEDVSILERTAHYAGLAIEMKGAEQELRAMTQLLIDAKSVAQVGTWRLALSSSQVTLSVGACEVFGLSPESLVHSLEFLLSLVHPEDVALVNGCLGASLAYEKPGVLDFRLLTTGGGFRIIRSQYSVINDEQHRPFLLVGTVQDVTELSRSEARAEVSDRSLKSISHGVLIADSDHLIISANPAFSEISGYDEAEILGRNCNFLQGPLTDPQTVEAMRTCLRNYTEFSGEILNCRKDGSPFWNEVTISPVQDSKGYWTHFVGITRDVTARKEAEIAFRTSEGQMELMFESSIAGACLVTLDGYFLKVNPALCSLVGFSEAELLNLSVRELTHPEDIAKIQAAMELIIQGHREFFELEKRCVHKNGLLIWCLVRITLARDAQGSPLHLIGHIRDIADRKRDEQRIFEAEARFRAAFEKASLGISISDLNGLALMVNEAYATNLGYRPGELVSTDLTRLVHPEELEVFYRMGTQLSHGEVPSFECESRHIHKDGRIVWIKSLVSLTRDAQGQPLNFIALAEDVTEKRQAKVDRDNLLLSERAARNEAERANQLKNDFLSTLSHELRTPLNAILGWVELLKDSEDDPETFAEGLAVISRNVRAQSKLIDDLLELSRIESGHVSFERKPVDVASAISAAVEVVRSAATAKSIGIATELCGAAVVVIGDAIRLQQVVWNFLSNAVKFTPAGGRVVVRLKRVGPCAEISVSDDGAGIRAEFLPHVFDRFRQQDSATTRLHGGLGIGLTLAKEFVEIHGGTVAAASLGEGRGATFTATLPLILAQGGEAESDLYPPSSRGDVVSLDGVRILIVDDQEDTRVLVTHTLEAEGGRVYAASNAVDGLAIVRNERPHVILSDIGMPIHDGYTFIKWVRSLSDAEGGRTPAAAFTAFARPQDKTLALASGFQLHVVKPVSRKQLVAAVVQLLAQAETPS